MLLLPGVDEKFVFLTQKRFGDRAAVQFMWQTYIQPVFEAAITVVTVNFALPTTAGNVLYILTSCAHTAVWDSSGNTFTRITIIESLSTPCAGGTTAIQIENRPTSILKVLAVEFPNTEPQRIIETYQAIKNRKRMIQLE